MKLNGFHFPLKDGKRHGSVAGSMPPFEHQGALSQDGFSNALRFSAALDKGLKVPQEMRLAQLA